MIKSFFQGFCTSHCDSHPSLTSSRFPRTWGALIEFFCWVTWLSLCLCGNHWAHVKMFRLKRNSRLTVTLWPLLPVRRIWDGSFGSRDNQLCSSLNCSFNKPIDFRSHRSARQSDDASVRTWLITGISFVWKSLAVIKHWNSNTSTVNTGCVTYICIWSRAVMSVQQICCTPVGLNNCLCNNEEAKEQSDWNIVLYKPRRLLLWDSYVQFTL